jgi:hypothetical protein
MSASPPDGATAEQEQSQRTAHDHDARETTFSSDPQLSQRGFGIELMRQFLPIASQWKAAKPLRITHRCQLHQNITLITDYFRTDRLSNSDSPI